MDKKTAPQIQGKIIWCNLHVHLLNIWESDVRFTRPYHYQFLSWQNLQPRLYGSILERLLIFENLLGRFKSRARFSSVNSHQFQENKCTALLIGLIEFQGSSVWLKAFSYLLKQTGKFVSFKWVLASSKISGTIQGSFTKLWYSLCAPLLLSRFRRNFFFVLSLARALLLQLN